jgi:gluconokinase
MASTSASNEASTSTDKHDGSVIDADVAPKEALLHNPPKLFEEHPGTKPHLTSPVLIIVMGVSGCGKSTVGKRLAEKFSIQFVDGDELHPKANIDKMSAGTPLTDEVSLTFTSSKSPQSVRLG